MKRTVFWTMAAMACVSRVAAQVPLPADVSITAPASEVRKEVAAFSGKWAGNWSGKLASVLIVETVDNERADVVYAWGDAPEWNTRAAYTRFRAKVSGDGRNQLTFGNPSGTISFTATMNRDLSTINVQRATPQGALVETFKRVAQ